MRKVVGKIRRPTLAIRNVPKSLRESFTTATGDGGRRSFSIVRRSAAFRRGEHSSCATPYRGGSEEFSSVLSRIWSSSEIEGAVPLLLKTFFLALVNEDQKEHHLHLHYRRSHYLHFVLLLSCPGGEVASLMSGTRFGNTICGFEVGPRASFVCSCVAILL